MVLVLLAVVALPAVITFFDPGGPNQTMIFHHVPLGARVTALWQSIIGQEQSVSSLLSMPPAIFMQDLFVSLLLVFGSVVIAAVIGVPLGTYAAINNKHWFRHIGPLGALIAQGIPTYVVATVLQITVGDMWRILPASGWDSPLSVVLPIVSLAAGNVGYIAKFMQAGMTDVLQKEYIISAKARGLSRFKVITRHALRPAALSTITFFGPQTAMLINNTLLLQSIFSIPGISMLLGEQMSGIQGVPQILGASGNTAASTASPFLNFVINTMAATIITEMPM